MTRTQEQMWRSMVVTVVQDHHPLPFNEIHNILHGATEHTDKSFDPIIQPPDVADLSTVVEQAEMYGMIEKGDDDMYRPAPRG